MGAVGEAEGASRNARLIATQLRLAAAVPALWWVHPGVARLQEARWAQQGSAMIAPQIGTRGQPLPMEVSVLPRPCAHCVLCRAPLPTVAACCGCRAPLPLWLRAAAPGWL